MPRLKIDSKNIDPTQLKTYGAIKCVAVDQDERGTLTLSDVNDDGVVKLSAGKKRHALLRVS